MKPNKESLYFGAEYKFSFEVDANLYPFNKGPIVKITPNIFHPNIEFDGSVCIDLLRENYKVTITIGEII